MTLIEETQVPFRLTPGYKIFPDEFMIALIAFLLLITFAKKCVFYFLFTVGFTTLFSLLPRKRVGKVKGVIIVRRVVEIKQRFHVLSWWKRLQAARLGRSPHAQHINPLVNRQHFTQTTYQIFFAQILIKLETP